MTEAGSWIDENQRHLTVSLARLKEILEKHSGMSEIGLNKEQIHQNSPGVSEKIINNPDQPFTLTTLIETFHLSPFERDILLLTAGMELDSSFPQLCAAVRCEPEMPYSTFGLALACLPEPHWSAITPGNPLRFWRLIDVAPGQSIMNSVLRIDEPILHYLTGVGYFDERLSGIIEPVPSIKTCFVTSHQAIIQQVVTSLQLASDQGIFPIIYLIGSDDAIKREIATAACELIGLNLSNVSFFSIPLNPTEIDALAHLWDREALITGSGLLFECNELDPNDGIRIQSVRRFVENIHGPLIISSREKMPPGSRPYLVFEVEKPNLQEQSEIWKAEIGSDRQNWKIDFSTLVSQFNFYPSTIRSVVLATRIMKKSIEYEDDNSIIDDISSLWDVCRRHARPRIENLAQRIESGYTWDDLVLPESMLHLLKEIAIHVRQRSRVYETWGFAFDGSRGLGISALFAGASGTGKTLAAEVLAHDLNLDLYRIDLSQVVSKYIGDTEKNLRQVFEAADDGGAILLFDEADALFGKRSEVKDSHDRYANIEVSYLLQQMEAYRGLAILTTNMKEQIDPAFLRRIRFIVNFPFPDSSQRIRIWERIFPGKTPTVDLDFGKLSHLNVTGGHIRNIALFGAFLAAEEDESVMMKHLLRAANVEYAKLERPLTEIEIGGWI